MQAAITDADKTLLTIIIAKMDYWDQLYLVAGREKLREWYNLASKRDICIRTLDYMIARLKNDEQIGRMSRTKDMGELGKQFITSLTKILPKGLETLRRCKVDSYGIFKRIRAVFKTRKERTPSEDSEGDREGSLTQLKDGISEVMKSHKPS